MTTPTNNLHPKLRPIEIKPISQYGEPYLLLRDPLELAGKTLLIPQHFAPLLMLCDGTRDKAGIRAQLEVQFGLRIGPEPLNQFLNALDESLFLDNEAYAQARTHALADYHAAPFRPPTHAGEVYPDDLDTLRHLLQSYFDDVKTSPNGANGRGLISPHIDYARGGPVYAQVWQRAAQSVQAADLVVILGTDHNADEGEITLTRQHYATPFGVLPTAVDVVDTLAEELGPEAAFANELHHRQEHSIELAAVWLHYLRENEPCEVVPILCGSFTPYIQDGADLAANAQLERLLQTMQQATAGRRVLFVAAGDLSHVGPAFGGDPLDLDSRVALRTADDELLAQMQAGDAAQFFTTIQRAEDRNNVCGTAPIYLMLRMLAPVQGEIVAYDSCPADQRNTSTVTVCGVVFE